MPAPSQQRCSSTQAPPQDRPSTISVAPGGRPPCPVRLLAPEVPVGGSRGAVATPVRPLAPEAP
eukprot:14501114-Alexandrium_andersonii.AAC.1